MNYLFIADNDINEVKAPSVKIMEATSRMSMRELEKKTDIYQNQNSEAVKNTNSKDKKKNSKK